MNKNFIAKILTSIYIILHASSHLVAQVIPDTTRIPQGLVSPAQLYYRTDLCTDSNGNIYIGLKNAGILKKSQGIWTHISTLSTGGQLPSDSIYKLHNDSQTGIWIGHGGGISNQNSNGFTNYLFNSSNGFPQRTITALSSDIQEIYIGTNTGLYVYDKNTGTAINFNSLNSILPSDSIKCLFKDQSGGIWIGTDLGYSILKAGVISNYSMQGTSISQANINDIIVTPFDTILMSSNYGLIRRINNSHVWLDSLYFLKLNISFCGTSLYSNLYTSYNPDEKKMINLTHDSFYNIYCLAEYRDTTLIFCIKPNHLMHNIYLGNYFKLNFLLTFPSITFLPSDSLIFYHGFSYRDIIYKIGTINSSNYNPTIPPFIPTMNSDSSIFPVFIPPSYTATEANAILEGNMVKARLLNRGDMHWDPYGQSPQYEVPQSTFKNTVYASSIWIGGFDQANQLVTAAQTYRQQSSNDFWPGPLDINGQTTPSINQLFDSIWIARRSDIDEFRFQYSLGNVQNGNYIIPNIILNWPVKFSNPNYPQKLAPYVDVNGDNIYNPYDGDYPAIKGDQMAWWVFNDYGMKTETNSNPFPVEIHAYAYSINCSNNTNIGTGLSYTTFYHYDVFNRSFGTYDSLYFGMWCDSDLGNASDDATGCNLPSNSFFFNNGDSIDDGGGGYGVCPPTQNICFLDAPLAVINDGLDNNHNGIIDESNEETGISNYVSYNNNNSIPTGNPAVTDDYYQYLSGTWLNGQPITYGGNGNGIGTGTTSIPTHFMFPGTSDSAFSTNWTMLTGSVQPNDMRGVGSAGPFTFLSGDTLSFDIAYITGPTDLTQNHQLVTDIRNLFRSGQIGNYSGSIPNIQGPTNISSAGSSVVYSVPMPLIGNSFLWTVQGGIIINGQGTDSITVQWGASGSLVVRLEVLPATGSCKATQVLNVQFSVGLVNESNEVTIKMFPNPTFGILNIETDDVRIINSRIYSLDGRVIQGSTFDGTVNTEGLTSGIYILELCDKYGIGLVRKLFMKQ